MDIRASFEGRRYDFDVIRLLDIEDVLSEEFEATLNVSLDATRTVGFAFSSRIDLCDSFGIKHPIVFGEGGRCSVCGTLEASISALGLGRREITTLAGVIHGGAFVGCLRNMALEILSGANPLIDTGGWFNSSDALEFIKDG